MLHVKKRRQTGSVRKLKLGSGLKMAGSSAWQCVVSLPFVVVAGIPCVSVVRIVNAVCLCAGTCRYNSSTSTCVVFFAAPKDEDSSYTEG